MDILDCKTLITNEMNNLFQIYQQLVEDNAEKEREWVKEKEMIHQANHRLIEEVAEKDKLLFHNEKKFLDYEIMINKIQDEALKEIDHKTKHDMLRAQDKEIFNRDEEIKRLQKRVHALEEEKRLVTDTVKEVVEDVEELREEINEKDDKTLIEKMKEITGTNKLEDDDDEEVVVEVEEVKELPLESNENKETGEVNPNIVYEEEEEEKEGEETESEEEGVVVETIKHYGKEYFIIEGEEPQYIYAIEDGELGEKKGEMKDGKKKMYKK